MSQRLVLFSKYILTMERPQPIEDGFVMIQGSRILQVGKRKDLYVLSSVRMLDLGDTILLPGLINAHCHLDFTALKGKVPYRGTFIDWLKRMGQVPVKPLHPSLSNPSRLAFGKAFLTALPLFAISQQAGKAGHSFAVPV